MAIIRPDVANPLPPLDALSGPAQPQSNRRFALASRPQAVIAKAPDAPGYRPEDTLFPYGFGLSY